jgi:hypothetical protein
LILIKFIFSVFVFLIYPTVLLAQDIPSKEYPLFIAALPNPNDFSLFANGGWDGNWYVGYNTCWIQKIKVPPKGVYERAFIGAKLGRMKSFHSPGQAPWEKQPFPIEIYMGIASELAWSKKQSFLLVSGQDIPLEGDPDNVLEGMGSAQWFWKEIPIELIRFDADHYLAIWSPTEVSTSRHQAPILAGGWGTNNEDSWINNTIQGKPPSNPKKSLKTPVLIFEPAIALKLIPYQSEKVLPQITITAVQESPLTQKSVRSKIVAASVQGENITRVWIEISTDQEKWERYGKMLWNAPYTFTIPTLQLPIGPKGQTWIRVSAADLFENIGNSLPINILETKNP